MEIGDRGSLEESTKIGFNTEEETVKHKTASFSIGCFFCALLSKEDCRKDEDNAEQQTSIDEALFCTLCNAEVKASCLSSFFRCYAMVIVCRYLSL